ncbi:unnamed protein product [Citrullus colocynthis]|uniref:Uncharacterized protein n=1 Tax=Citrullus colocynthis TaxID=252529 RepID=A0ABP0YHC7_9ROSI
MKTCPMLIETTQHGTTSREGHNIQNCNLRLQRPLADLSFCLSSLHFLSPLPRFLALPPLFPPLILLSISSEIQSLTLTQPPNPYISISLDSKKTSISFYIFDFNPSLILKLLPPCRSLDKFRKGTTTMVIFSIHI